MERLHLDSEYRNRWIEFYLADGTVEDSRLKNWRHVAWRQVVSITAYLQGHSYSVDCEGLGFKTFMNFRWGGQEARYDELGRYTGIKPIGIWTIGWTDGKDCFLKDIDFYTGQFIKDYKTPLSQFKTHLHPDVIEVLR
jgi:hypothetical protein